MCMSPPKIPTPAPPPPPPAPTAPPPPPNVLQQADGTRRADSSTMTALRGRNTLRIDRTSSGLGGGSGSGLNIPS